MPLTTVSCKFNPEEVELLSRTVDYLRERNPDLEPTRSDAVRFLVASSASVLASEMTVAIAVPPGAVPPKARRKPPG